ncbi:glycosyltransferase [Mucilaginibacter limnophilus]|uniref:Glycosyltransferase n=1 Tax=Mucilaginibacter limnophilus TaxID=1932778 RepID=A0A3S2VQF7_9SPHI|nr:glycosyltransferase [Mucilaginibacter limnophilus]RVU03016.1 glycosyltransferase [Mucilaginibacter limnophilus]
MKTPAVSIITVTYNAAAAIETTIKSIIDQPFGDYEYLVIDGNSTDGTKEIIQKYSDKITKFISEPDKGIPDALNKGVKLATGKYIVFILAGDELFTIPYKQLAHSDADVVCFPVKLTGDEVHYPEINNWLKIRNTIPHQGAYFKRTPNLAHDLKYRYYCDFALCQIYYKNKLRFEIHDGPIVAFHGLDGATSDKKNFHEVFSIIKENYGTPYKVLSFIYWKYFGLMKRLKMR